MRLTFKLIFTSFLCVTLSYADPTEYGWNLVSSIDFVRMVSTRNGHVWAINKAHQAVYLKDGQWVVMDNSKEGVGAVAAANDGTAWVGRNVSTKNGFRLALNLTTWESQPCMTCASYNVKEISAISHDLAVCLGPYGGVHYYAKNKWQPYPNYGNGGIKVAIGDGSEVWRIDKQHAIFRYNGTTWLQVQGKAENLDVQSDKRIVITDEFKNVYTRNGGEWKQLEGLDCVQASINYESVYCVDSKNALWKLDDAKSE